MNVQLVLVNSVRQGQGDKGFKLFWSSSDGKEPCGRQEGDGGHVREADQRAEGADHGHAEPAG